MDGRADERGGSDESRVTNAGKIATGPDATLILAKRPRSDNSMSKMLYLCSAIDEIATGLKTFVGIVGELGNAIGGRTVDEAPPLGSEREASTVNQVKIGQYDFYSTISSHLICCADFSDLLQSRILLF
jgi:hypothetical protein